MQKLWARAYVCNAGINFLIYVVYFMMMLWTVLYAGRMGYVHQRGGTRVGAFHGGRSFHAGTGEPVPG